MPCAKCNTPLFVDYNLGDMRCPNCASLSIESPATIRNEVQALRDYFGEEAMVEFLQQFDKEQLILSLIRLGNKAAANLLDPEERGFPVRDFVFSIRFVRQLISEDNFGDEQLDLTELPPPKLDTVLTHRFSVLRTMEHLEDQFKYAYPHVSTPGESSFFDQYTIFDSEFAYCFERNLESLNGAYMANRPEFDKKSLEFHDFDTPSADEIESARDFGRTFHELIVSMSFVMSSSDALNDVFRQSFPEAITLVKLDALLDALDATFSDSALNSLHKTGELGVATWNQLEYAGGTVFGDDWSQVRDHIVMYPGNDTAHPFLFALPLTQETSQGQALPAIEYDQLFVLYPRHYSRFIRFQMFPQIYDEQGRKGHKILDSIQSERGKPTYERNIHDYLVSEGYQVFHSAEHHSKTQPHEIDLLVVDNSKNEVWFIECKYSLPSVNMDASDGVEKYNKKMNEKIFPESGEAFDERVDWWLSNMVGENFVYQAGKTEEDLDVTRFRDSWGEYNIRRFVVSPVAPSFTVKRGIRFLTDLEFLKFVEEDELPLIPKREEWIRGPHPNK